MDFSLAAFAVAKADEATRTKIREALRARFSEHVIDGVVKLAARVHVVTAGR